MSNCLNSCYARGTCVRDIRVTAKVYKVYVCNHWLHARWNWTLLSRVSVFQCSRCFLPLRFLVGSRRDVSLARAFLASAAELNACAISTILRRKKTREREIAFPERVGQRFSGRHFNRLHMPRQKIERFRWFSTYSDSRKYSRLWKNFHSYVCACVYEILILKF